jgi:predicted phosphate transport protein (TIGR00153 family)
MNTDAIRKFFVPKRQYFFPLFESSAVNLVKASLLLKELMESSDRSEHERINTEIKSIEHTGDEITVKIYDQLNNSFITPFDREDIHELNGHIDDVVDSINNISRRVCFYKPERMIPAYSNLAGLILDGSKEIETAVHYLKDLAANKRKMSAAFERVKQIEHEADEIYFQGVSELFQNEENAKELLKNNKILELLERCINQEEDVADTIEAILIKMA